MLTAAELRNGLSACVDAAGLYTDAVAMAPFLAERRGIVKGEALAVVLPSCCEQVVALVHYARQQGLCLVPQGGNTSLVGAACPQDKTRHVVIASKRLNTIEQIDEDNAIVIAESGCTLAEVQRRLASSGLFFPISLAAAEWCQLGGMVATNAGGLRVLRYGMMRENIRGLEVVLADGRVLNTLTLCSKDNRGYPLTQLFCGSEGTLGFVTKVGLTLHPRPPPTRCAFVIVTDIVQAWAFYRYIRQHAYRGLYACEYMAADVMALVASYAGLSLSWLKKGYDYLLIELEESMLSGRNAVLSAAVAQGYACGYGSGTR